jgi:general stress protein YciG
MAQERKNQSGGTANRGFASMDPERQREIARKGGATVSQNREHMAEIGRKGGEASGTSRSNRANQQSAESNP